MATLRDPEKGCPWDREQSWASLTRHTLEEAYEVADAARAGDPDALRNELGDLLFQVVFYAQIASEQASFDFESVASGLADKLIARHPHVFASENQPDKDTLARQWEEQKAQERGLGSENPSELDGVPRALPALSRAQKLQKRASRVGFDWADSKAVLEKLEEESSEFMEAIRAGDRGGIREELGDLLFTLVNVSRHLEQDAETALQEANEKFERRFRAMETVRRSQAGDVPAKLSVNEWDVLWNAVKDREKDG